MGKGCGDENEFYPCNEWGARKIQEKFERSDKYFLDGAVGRLRTKQKAQLWWNM